jgi:hypothetical protein
LGQLLFEPENLGFGRSNPVLGLIEGLFPGQGHGSLRTEGLKPAVRFIKAPLRLGQLGVSNPETLGHREILLDLRIDTGLLGTLTGEFLLVGALLGEAVLRGPLPRFLDTTDNGSHGRSGGGANQSPLRPLALSATGHTTDDRTGGRADAGSRRCARGRHGTGREQHANQGANKE